MLFSPIPHTMSRAVRRVVIAVLLITRLQGLAVAGPQDLQGGQNSSHDPNAPAPDSPWLDLSPAPVLAMHGTDNEARPTHKLAASLTLAGLYVGFGTWTLVTERIHPGDASRTSATSRIAASLTNSGDSGEDLVSLCIRTSARRTTRP